MKPDSRKITNSRNTYLSINEFRYCDDLASIMKTLNNEGEERKRKAEEGCRNEEIKIRRESKETDVSQENSEEPKLEVDDEDLQEIEVMREPKLKYIKIDNEDIQEIEEVKYKSILEIDLTEEDEIAEQNTTKKSTEKFGVEEDKKMLKNKTISIEIEPFHIKEKLLKVNDIKMKLQSGEPRLLADITHKMDVENKESSPLSINVEDDDEISENSKASWTQANTSTTLDPNIVSSIDGNTEFTMVQTLVQKPISVPKVNIRTSALKSTTEEHLNSESNSNKISSSDEPDTMKEIEIYPPPFKTDYNRKPRFKGVTLINTPPVQRGVQIASLCSVM